MDPLPPAPAEEPFQFIINDSTGKSTTMEIPANQLSKIDHLVLSLLLAFEDDKKDGIFRGYSTSLSVKNEPRVMISVIDTLVASMTPVISIEGRDSSTLDNVEPKLCKSEVLLQTTEWHVTFDPLKKAFKPSPSPRAKSFTTALASLEKMFAVGRSGLYIGLGF